MVRTAVKRAYELGKQYMKEYGGCSQCVIAALQDTFNLRNEAIFKAATGLAGGGARAIDGSCGAYSGSLLILSFLLGRERSNFADPEGIRFRTAEIAKKLHDKFIQEYGSVVCYQIQTKLMGRPFYLPDPDESEKFKAAGAYEVHCSELVGKTA